MPPILCIGDWGSSGRSWAHATAHRQVGGSSSLPRRVEEQVPGSGKVLIAASSPSHTAGGGEEGAGLSALQMT